MSGRRCAGSWLATLALVSSTACSSDHGAKSRAAYLRGDFETAEEHVVERAGDSDEREVALLDHAVLNLAQGEPASAVAHLREVRDAFNERDAYDTSWLDPSRLASEVGATLTDDRALSYLGRDYERLALYGLLALAELMRGGGTDGDVMPFLFQSQDEVLKAIEQYEDPNGDRPKEGYRLVAFGEYLRAAYLSESPTRRDEAERAFNRFLSMHGEYPAAGLELGRITGASRPDPGSGVVYVFGLVGAGPVLVESQVSEPSALALAWIQLFWRAYRGNVGLPILAPIKVPALATVPVDPPHLVVEVGGQAQGRTGVISDLSVSARAEFDSMRDVMLARAYVRRLVKIVLAEGANALVEKHVDSEWSGVIQFVVDLLFNVSAWAEKADLRGWSFLPAQVQALRLELPEGVHRITLQAGDAAGGRMAATSSREVRVRAGRHSYVLGIFPSPSVSTPLLTSSPAPPAR